MTERKYSAQEMRWHIVKMMKAGRLYNTNDFVEQLGFTKREVVHNLIQLGRMGIIDASTPSYSRTKVYQLVSKADKDR
jgi:predicted transcriptional regulator